MNISKKIPSNIWIGLVHVRGKNQKLLGAENAYVTVVSIAENKTHFRQKINDALLEMEMQLTKLEDAEPLHNRVEKFKVSNNILKLATNLSEKKDQVAFSTFHAYS